MQEANPGTESHVAKNLEMSKHPRLAFRGNLQALDKLLTPLGSPSL